jgi:heme exporter protein C
MDGLMLFTLFVGVVAFTSLFAWLVVHRQRVQAMSDAIAVRALDDAIAVRGVAG